MTDVKFSLLLVIAWIILLFIVNQVWRTVYTGRLAALLQDSLAFAQHRTARRNLGWLFAMEVIIAELLSQWPEAVSPAISAVPHPLLYVHLAIDACFAIVALLIVLRFNGERSPRRHRHWVYCGFIPLSIAVIVTGGILLYWLR